MPTEPPIPDGFQQAVAKFSLRLTKKEFENFKFSTLKDLHRTLDTIQTEQGKRRELMNLTRIQAFLEAMDQYGKVVEVFLNASSILCFVWGPMKFLLQTASNWAESFDTLLDAYQQLAENIPLLAQYKVLFENSPQMSGILSIMYEDILEFHRCALRFFTKPTWRQLFRSTWRDFICRFQHILDDLRRHKELIETQANLSQFQESRAFRMQCEISFADVEETRRENQRLAVINWLSSADTHLDQEASAAARRDYPGACRWILEKPEIRAWYDLDDSLVRLVWVNGIPGAGKSTLVSLLVEECEKVPSTSLGFFYCKHQDDQRNNFLALTRTILAQLLHQNQELLPYLYDQCLSSGQPSLVSLKLCEDLLKTVLSTISTTYLIIDGIDECILPERKAILSFFTAMIDADETPGRLRGMFVSQDENDIKKLLRAASVVRLQEGDNKSDIKGYATQWSLKIQEKFELSSDEQNHIVIEVCRRAQEMFLFAKLVLTNLFSQTSKVKLYTELQPETFPKGFEQAYGRIVSRVLHNTNEAERDAARKLLGWVIGAKRPLKWHEIQGAITINAEDQNVNFEDEKLRVDNVKDLCGSLVEILPGDRVSLVHRIAEIHLVEGNYVHIPTENYKLAILCLRYLTFECFDCELADEKVKKFLMEGYYSFQDYAVLHWVDHLESYVTSLDQTDLPNYEDFGSAIEEFFTVYGAGDTKRGDVRKELEESCVILSDAKYFESLLLLITHARQARKLDEGMSALGDLGRAIVKIRSFLEDPSIAPPLEPEIKKRLEVYYGALWNKCPRHLCFYFHEGFSTTARRDQHVDRHERPFCCTQTGCPRILYGFSAEKELKKHIMNNHPDPSTFAWKFPKVKKEPTKHSCSFCDKEYTRASNLRIHLRTHKNERPFKCKTCGKAFVRKHDCERHERLLHNEQGQVVGQDIVTSSQAMP